MSLQAILRYRVGAERTLCAAWLTRVPAANADR